MTTPHEHILTGLRVLDLTRYLAGPTCSRMLAEMGAEVIKIEPTPAGDMTRQISKLRNERSLYFIQQNLNKKSLCIDLRDPRGLQIVKDLVPHVDVVVENYKPGVMKAMGLGFEDLQKLRPDIILCSVSALGQTGPLATKPGYDFIAQSYSGVTSMIGEPDDAPYIPLLGIGDVATGVHGALGITAALLYRNRTGKGQHIDVALLDTYYHMHEVNVHRYSGSNGAIKPMRAGRHLAYVCPAGVFRATNGAVTIMAFLHHWKDLCAAMERPDLVGDPKFATDPARLERLDEVIAIIEGFLARFPDVASAVARLEECGVPCAPVLSVEETVHHPHHVARGTVRTVDDAIAGEFQIPGMPVRFSGFEANQPYVAPTLGEHNAEILRDVLGRSEADIASLHDAGVLLRGEF
jgi:crotonobetainyl-CoA:carnitine CoA-transferase CaiB-like acyl-CoA transferase